MLKFNLKIFIRKGYLMKKLIALVTFMVMLCVPCSADDLSAECENGTFVGVLSSDNIITWLGVPYAKSPTPPRRWKAPEAPEASTETFNADTWSSMPIQQKGESRATGMMPQDEDCLYLNVWKASDDKAVARPVMVWIHGGSFRYNGTGDPEWTGHNIVADNHDVIVVSVGYRLGLMGFIDFSAVDGGEDFAESGNLGLLDVLQSLKWLKANIAKFGGDPNNITVFGQSSGSALISLLMTMPEAQGLFQRAILQSGAISMSMARKSTTEDATLLAKKLLELTGKSDMAGLMTVSSMDLQEATAKLDGMLNFPERDGVVLSEDIYTAFATNAGNYDVLIGSNADEVNYFVAAVEDMSLDVFGKYVGTAYEQIRADAGSVPTYGEALVASMDKFIEIQGEVSPVWAYTEFLNELLFRMPAIQMASSHAGTGKTYMYYWNIPSVNPYVGELFGACHGSEIPYVLDVPGLLVPVVDPTIRQAVQGMWVDFARDGTITGHNMYTEANRATIVISADATVISEENDPLGEQRELIAPLLALNISGRDIINAMSSSASEEDTNTNNTNNNLSGSSSGCNIGFLPLMLMMLVIPAAVAKRH